ncbi:methionine ABC transporter ATP-binding protein [Geminicoccaceae bacterium 1502E]|nr:methionine ABC transporter ATP-binding protein [Geminicoccaceae bacterium 1502E]
MIRLEQLSRSFAGPHGAVPALDGVDLGIEAGEIFGIIGRSGAGKSTLIRCINLLERPDSGRVLVDGADITRLSRAQLNAARRGMGMVFQHFNLLASRTVMGNVAFPLEIAGVERARIRERVEELLELVGLADKRDQYPSRLSGGQKQRVGIARALAHAPRILLCDEATSALDPETTGQILELLRSLRDRLELTVVLITHEMGVVQAVADRVAVMERGRIIEQGRVFDVFTRPKEALTRRFVREVIDQELPAELEARVPEGSTILRVLFTGPNACRPVIAEAARRFGVDFNVLHGRIDEIRGEPFGTMALATDAALERLAPAAAWMRSLGLEVEEVAHVAAARRSAA